MKTLFIGLLLSGSLALGFGNDSEFCQGFEIGYKTVKGNMAMTPMCPIEPITPIGSTPYQEGLKKGMRKARSAAW